MKKTFRITGHTHYQKTPQPFSTTIEIEEHGNKTPYGHGQYVSLTHQSGDSNLYDLRYMKGYTFKKACEAIIKEYYGENAEQIEEIE